MNCRIATWDVIGRYRGTPFLVVLGRVELVQFGHIYHALFRPASDDDLLIWSSGPDAVATMEHVAAALKVAYGGVLLH